MIYCNVCYGEGVLSVCCDAPTTQIGYNTHQCENCMKFCSVDYCDRCIFFENIKVGEDIDLFISKWSDENLKRMFRKSKFKDDTFLHIPVKILKINDDGTFLVKSKKHKEPFQIEFDDISL